MVCTCMKKCKCLTFQIGECDYCEERLCKYCVIKKDQLKDLIKAQDIVRRLWANATDSEIEKQLKLLDKEMTKRINSIGKK